MKEKNIHTLKNKKNTYKTRIGGKKTHITRISIEPGKKKNITKKLFKKNNGGGMFPSRNAPVADVAEGEPGDKPQSRISRISGVAASAAKDGALKLGSMAGKAASAAGKGLFELAKLSVANKKTEDSGGSSNESGFRNNQQSSYQTSLSAGQLTGDLQSKLYESICSNMNNLFIQNSSKFETTITSAIQAMFETDTVKNKFKQVIADTIDKFANDPETSREMNAKIESKILDCVANHIMAKLTGTDVSITKERILDLLKKDPSTMATIASAAPDVATETTPDVEPETRI